MNIIFYKKDFYRKVDATEITEKEVQSIKDNDFLDLDKLPEGVIDALVDAKDENDEQEGHIKIEDGIKKGRPFGSKGRSLSERANVSGKQPVKSYPYGMKPEKKKMSDSTKRVYNMLYQNPGADTPEIARLMGLSYAGVQYHKSIIYKGGNWISKFGNYRTRSK